MAPSRLGKDSGVGSLVLEGVVCTQILGPCWKDICSNAGRNEVTEGFILNPAKEVDRTGFTPPGVHGSFLAQTHSSYGTEAPHGGDESCRRYEVEVDHFRSPRQGQLPSLGIVAMFVDQFLHFQEPAFLWRSACL